MFQRQYNILSSFLGESKQGGYISGVDQYQFCCPSCADNNNGKMDNKFNLEVNFVLGKFHCWKCDIKGNLVFLIKKYGSLELSKEYIKDVKMVLSVELYRLEEYSELAKIVNKEEINLPKTFTLIGNINQLKNKKLKQFLLDRKITQEMVDKYHLGYTQWENEEKLIRSRLIIPSYDKNDNLNFWVGRDFTGYDRQKYLNVKADRKEIIFNEGLIEWDADIVLVEGIIDSLVYPNCIPLMGKQLLQDSLLYNKLISNANAHIYICLDNDTHIDETKRIYSLLNRGRLKNKIRYIRMIDFKDFGEVYEQQGKQGLLNVLSDWKTFDNFDLIF